MFNVCSSPPPFPPQSLPYQCKHDSYIKKDKDHSNLSMAISSVDQWCMYWPVSFSCIIFSMYHLPLVVLHVRYWTATVKASKSAWFTLSNLPEPLKLCYTPTKVTSHNSFISTNDYHYMEKVLAGLEAHHLKHAFSRVISVFKSWIFSKDLLGCIF